MKFDSIRYVWPHEAHDFTPWLYEHLDTLSRGVGLKEDLIALDREVYLGRYKADILARTSVTNKKVIIENMYGVSDHDHLGKLVTYAGWCEADMVIWIVEKANIEHRAGVELLNKIPNFEVILVEIEVDRDNHENPIYKIMTAPTKTEKDAHDKKSADERNKEFSKYWNSFKEYANVNMKRKPNFHIPEKAQSWIHINTSGGSKWHIELKVRNSDNTIWAQFYGEKNIIKFFKTEWFEELVTNWGRISRFENDMSTLINFYDDTIDAEQQKVTMSYCRYLDFYDQENWQEQFQWYCDMLDYMIDFGDKMYQIYLEENQ